LQQQLSELCNKSCLTYIIACCFCLLLCTLSALLLQLYRSMRAFVADAIYLAGEVLLQDRGLVLVPQVGVMLYSIKSKD
jgi:hypothetical protein